MLLKELSPLASPLSDQQVNQLKSLASELSSTQLSWVSGYLAAKSEVQGVSLPEAKKEIPTITLLYGSQTGNGRGIAQELVNKAAEQGLTIASSSMADYKPRALKQETVLLIIVSTHGEGEAPDDAIELHQFLSSKRAPKLDALQYSVLALGDSSYEFFCQTGKDFDSKLALLGAKALAPLVECDVDYEAQAEAWQQSVLDGLMAQEVFAQDGTSGGQVVTSVSPVNVNGGGISQYTKKQPFAAEVIVSQKLTGRDSDRDVRHVELDLGESGITYQPGDSLGVWFENADELVESLLKRLDFAGDTQVELAGDPMSIEQALRNKLELTQLFPKLVSSWAELAENDQLLSIASDKSVLRDFILKHQLIDLVEKFSLSGKTISAQTFVDLLRPITPRLYSIASSQSEVDTEVHLTVALVEQQDELGPRFGGASRFLANAEEGQEARVYVEPNSHFRLPTNPDTSVIMIGPGTGVAPFRAFLQQRSADAASGNNWLFFGNPHFEQDFLYQTEWQQYLKSGELTRLDLAFSRDQASKIYVQDRIREQGQSVWKWLEEGAYLYVCGDAERMAKDVHQALLDVISEYGGKDQEQAQIYLDELRAEHRYQKDVY